MHDFFSATDQKYNKNLRHKFNRANNSQLMKYQLSAIFKIEELLLNICVFLYWW